MKKAPKGGSTRPRFETLAIHAGQAPEPITGAVMTPIFLTSTYAQNGPGEHKGFEYSRTQNPTRFALEANLAALEGGRLGAGLQRRRGGLHGRPGTCWTRAITWWPATTSTAAPSASSTRCSAGSGLTFTYVDARDAGAVAAAMTPAHQALLARDAHQPAAARWPTSAAVAKACAARRVRLCVDNTFMTPVLPAPAGPGRGPGRPLDHQVPERPLGRGGRRDHRRATPNCGRGWRSSRTRWAAASRPSTASWSCAGPRRWRCAWSGTSRTRWPSRAGWRRGATSSRRHLPGPEVTPAARAGPTPDERLRRHGRLHLRQRPRRPGQGPPLPAARCASSPAPSRWAASNRWPSTPPS